VHHAPDRSDLYLDELWLPHLAARYDVLYTQRETLRLGRRRPATVLQLHEHHHTRYAPWTTRRAATRGAWQIYRGCTAYERAEHICFSSSWTYHEFVRLEERVPRSSSIVPLSGWPDHREQVSSRQRRQQIIALVSSDPRDELHWALRVWRHADLPEPWELVVVGLDSAAAGMGDSDLRVRAGGRLGDAALFELMATARGYLHTGRVEGFGLSILEALQLGTPAVARAGSATSELLDDGGGWLVGPDPEAAATALAELSSADPVALEHAARQAGGRFSWSATARGVLDACASVLRSKTR